MKKYIAPTIETQNTDVFNMIALSLQEDKADGSEVLSREDVAWDLWNDAE